MPCPAGHSVPLDKAAIARPGTTVTPAPPVAQVAAEESGVDAEVIDLQLWPLDLDAIVTSVKTGRCVVHEATRTCGF